MDLSAAVVAAPAVQAAAGSVASSLMSAAAVANGGGVAAGSVVGVLQAAGAVASGGITGTVGTAVSSVARLIGNCTA